MAYMVYSIATLHTSHQAPPLSNASGKGRLFKGTLIFDSVITISLIATGILAIVALTTQIHGLQLFTHSFVWAITCTSTALVIVFVDLFSMYLLKRREKNKGNIFDTHTIIKKSTQQHKAQHRKATPTPLVVSLPSDKEVSSSDEDFSSEGEVAGSNWNSIYVINSLGNDAGEDTIFMPLMDIDASTYETVAENWRNLSWFKKLDKDPIQKFEKFLNNIQTMAIPREMEVFSDLEKRADAYNIFKKAVIYLYNQVHEKPDLGERVVFQLMLAASECPLAYLSCISTALRGIANTQDLSGTAENKCKVGFHQLY